MIISDLYQTKISTPSFEVKINSVITVTVKLLDFNNRPVTGKQVSLNVDRGTIQAITTGTSGYVADNKLGANAVTDSNGEIAVTYKASSWGLATFTANMSHSQIKVSGWKKIGDCTLAKSYSSNKPTATLYSNGEMGALYFKGAFSVTKNSNTKIASFSSSYAPPYTMYFLCYNTTARLQISNGGVVNLYAPNASQTIGTIIHFPLKSKLTL